MMKCRGSVFVWVRGCVEWREGAVQHWKEVRFRCTHTSAYIQDDNTHVHIKDKGKRIKKNSEVT
jgi:hypothetical protein